MGWYLKETIGDQRFRWALEIAGGALLAIIAAFLTNIPWMLKVAYFALFPTLALSILGMFLVFGLVVHQDYRERKIILKRGEARYR